MNIAVSSNTLDLETLTTQVNDQVQPLLQSINGVADVTVVGGLTRQIQVRRAELPRRERAERCPDQKRHGDQQKDDAHDPREA